jgi:AraC family transcriptional regulator, activator of mtrCDE
VTHKPPSRVAPADLDHLMTSLDVSFVKLAECLVSPGWRLALTASDAPGIHYNLGGHGRMIVADQAPIDLLPHTLVIVPEKQPFLIEGPTSARAPSTWMTVQGELRSIAPGELRRFVAGDGEPLVMLICGYFRALYGASIDVFESLPSPIVERFDADDQLDQKLKAAMAELMTQQVGTDAMTAALMKQILVTLLRRSLRSSDTWVERFSILGDRQIARAFADMVARPSASHSAHSLSRDVGLSRSAFMARFTAALGSSPMAVLRQLRMRRAAFLLAANDLSIDQVAYLVGYASRSSFSRAFRKAYGSDPSDYRFVTQRTPEPSLSRT